MVYQEFKKGYLRKTDTNWQQKPNRFLQGCWFCPGSGCILETKILRRVGPYNENLKAWKIMNGSFVWSLRWKNNECE